MSGHTYIHTHTHTYIHTHTTTTITLAAHAHRGLTMNKLRMPKHAQVLNTTVYGTQLLKLAIFY